MGLQYQYRQEPCGPYPKQDSYDFPDSVLDKTHAKFDTPFHCRPWQYVYTFIPINIPV